MQADAVMKGCDTVTRKKFCQFIKGVKLPDGLGSNFKHKVTDSDSNITGMKSHDCHIMMQRLLPYRLQQYLDTNIAKPLIELCSFFKQIYSRTLMEDDMVKAKSQLVDILCNLEQIYPSIFFDIMIHLVIHLPQEALEGGPIPYRWIYPFERYMKKLKNYVRNQAKPESSIAKGYVAEEALTFCSHYFWDVTMKFNRPDCNVDCPPLTEFPNQDMKEEFPGCLWTTSNSISVNSCIVNGVRFAIHNCDEHRTTQNNGICSPGEKDGEMYYGQIEEILEFLYMSFKVVLFRVKCELFNDHQYILATQDKQVFYLEDMARRPLHWKVIQYVNHNKFSNGGVIVVEDDHDLIHFNNSSNLALSTSLNDLDFATLNIDGQSMDVEAPPDIIDIYEDVDFIDDEDGVPHDLSDSDDEVLTNDDDDDVVVVLVARGHDGDGGGDDPSRPPPRPIRTGTMLHLGENFAQWSNLIGEIVREYPMYYPFWNKIAEEKRRGFWMAHDWDKQIDYWLDPKNATRSAQNAQNWAKSKVAAEKLPPVHRRHVARESGTCRRESESSFTNHFSLSNKPTATFISGYIIDLSPVKDNIKLRDCFGTAICDDEVLGWLFANQPSEQSENTAMKISTAFKNSTNVTFVNKHPIRNIVELLGVEQGVQSVIVGTVIAIQEDEGSICKFVFKMRLGQCPYRFSTMRFRVGRSAYQLCEKYAKVAIDDYNVKKLLHVFTVLRFSNDQEIINSVLACATPIKDNEAKSNTVLAITSLDLESQTDKNTTPNEKQKTNKHPAEGKPRNTTIDENDPANARKRKKELMSNRKHASSKDKRSNPSFSSDAFLTGHVRRTPKQSTNLATSPLAFGNSKTPTLENSNVSQSFILCNTINHDNSSTLGRNSSPTSCNQVTPVDQACKRRSPLSDVSNGNYYDHILELIPPSLFGPKKTSSTVVTPTIRPFSTQTSTYEVGESSRRTKRSKRPALQNHTPIRFNLDDDGNVRKVYDKYYGISKEYYDHGDPTFKCKKCHALLWEAEAKRGNPNPVNKAYSICCKKGKVMLEKPPDT
nr:hypothetical protein [Tanacetum cinerariifolium]